VAAEGRAHTTTTVLIDKLDNFVAGQEYETQKLYIGSLLEVEDDLRQKTSIKCKIFLREDLFDRLDFTSLGYDKVQDNMLSLRWSNEECLRFLGLRIAVALMNAGVVEHPSELIRATDTSDYDVKNFDQFIIRHQSSKLLGWLTKVLRKLRPNDRARQISLYSKFDRAIITKVFPRNISHINRQGEREDICIFEFINTHFNDGNGSCTPRYLLIFLKEVRDRVCLYYSENPDEKAPSVLIDGDWEWGLFKRESVELAYISSKEKYLTNIRTFDNKWDSFVKEIIEKKGNKTKFDYKWIRNTLDGISEIDAKDLLAFLQVIGFFKVTKYKQDISKREFELPILYK